MKKIIFICFLFNALNACPQDVSIALSKQFKLKDFDYTKTSVADKLGNIFYSIRFTQKKVMFALTERLDKINFGVELNSYDADMNIIKTVQAHNGLNNFGPLPPKMKIFNNHVLLFFYQLQNDGSIKLFVSEIDHETLAEAPPIELYSFSQKNVGFLKIESAFDDNKLGFCLMPDSSKLLVAVSGTTNEIFSCLIDNNLGISGKKISVLKNNPNAITINSAFVDKDENRYFGYSYKEDKIINSGILIQNNKGADIYLPFNKALPGSEGGDLFISGSRDNTKVYVYAGYKIGDLNTGVVITTVDAGRLIINKPLLFPYPPEMLQRLHKIDFAYKSKGKYSIANIKFDLIDLGDGTIALAGFPFYTKETSFTQHTVIESFAGPIIAIFFKDGNGTATMIPRKQSMSPGSQCIYFPWKNNLVCIYNDREKNLQNDEEGRVSSENNPSDLVLAEAVISSNGTIISRKKIADNPEGSNYFFTLLTQQLSAHSFIMPVGRIRYNMIQYFTEIVQWATLTIQ